MENQPIQIIERSNEKPQLSLEGKTGRSHTPIIKGEEIRVNFLLNLIHVSNIE